MIDFFLLLLLIDVKRVLTERPSFASSLIDQFEVW
jgi:hypothetical protein